MHTNDWIIVAEATQTPSFTNKLFGQSVGSQVRWCADQVQEVRFGVYSRMEPLYTRGQQLFTHSLKATAAFGSLMFDDNVSCKARSLSKMERICQLLSFFQTTA